MVDRIKLEAYLENGRDEPNRATSSSDYTFPTNHNPTRIRKRIGTEWRVRHVGTSPYPRYRWRRRETLRVTVEGGMYADEITVLEGKFLFRQLRDGIGICFRVRNADEYGIKDSEYWVINSPLDWRTTRQGKLDSGIFVPWVNYTFSGQLVYDSDFPPF